MHLVESVAADAKGVRLKRILRVPAGFDSDKAKVGIQCWRGEENWAERGT